MPMKKTNKKNWLQAKIKYKKKVVENERKMERGQKMKFNRFI